MNQQQQAKHEPVSSAPTQASRQQWIDAVAQMAESDRVKSRIECLEREVAAQAFATWHSR